MEQRVKCDCDIGALLEAARTSVNPLAVSRFTETTGFVWCDKHRVHVSFTAPKEAWGDGKHG